MNFERTTKMHSWFGRGRSLQVAVSGCCLLAFTLFGYDQGVFGGILQNADWLNQFGHPSDTKTGIIVASYNLGCLLGCFINFWIGNPLGRRKVIWLAASIIIFGAILQTTAFSVAHLVIGRIVTGMGTGLETSTVPMYQSELCEGHKRGRLVSAEVLFVGVGISLAYWFDFGMSFAGGPIAWRLPIAFQIVFAVVVIVLVFGLPESPRWLYNHDRAEEAVEVMCMIYDKPAEDPLIEHEISQIIDAIKIEESNGRFKWRNIFKKDPVQTGRRVLLAWGVQCMNQVGGINLVVYYITTVLVENVGLDPQLAQILGGCINMMFMFGSLVPSFFLDQMGRRKTMFWGCAGLGFSMMMISILLSFQGTSVEKQTAAASVAFFFTYMLIFGGTVNCVPWVYVPEILPLEARAKGTAVGISSNWLWNFTIVMITPIIINRLQWKAYLIFMVTNFAFIPIFYFFYPETSNKTLEDIDFLFINGGRDSGLPKLPFVSRTTDSSTDIEQGNTSEEGLKKAATQDLNTQHVEKI
ncbi:probable transporter (major facilitator superfamily) [Phialocephala subalpina]|uniref:Probable transporter (Major facilitator superfamily) n=1 Tax=Phialocephala subalpina TaxID=576137 RepID=A0A1L7WC80_9HELO|nr:probable transporter (major facilitator superfamily) [Phialocephala subalpina]